MPHPGRARKPGENVIDWCQATGRIDRARAAQWRQRVAADPQALSTYEHLAGALVAGCAVALTASGTPVGDDSVPGVSRAVAPRGGGSVSIAAAVVPAGQLPTGRVAAASAGDPGGHFALNPLLAQAQLQDPDAYAAALEVDPNPPTLFASGDLPAFTTSGAAPAMLASAPWYARHALAAMGAADFQAAYEVLAGSEGIAEAQDPRYLRHLNNEAYESRVVSWLAAGDRLIQERRSEASRQQAEEVRAAEAEAMGDPATWTDEQVFAAVYGPTIRREAELHAERVRAAQDPSRDLGPLGYRW